MPRNTRGGNKAKRGKNAPKSNNRALRTKDSSNEMELYAKVVSRAGGSPPIIVVMCEDGKERHVVVRGKFAKKVWMNKDDVVLITLNADSGESGEITVKYNPGEVSRLEQINEITSTTFGVEDHNDNITFTNEAVGTKEIDSYFTENEPNEEDKGKTFIAFDDDEDSNSIDIDEI